MEDSTRPPQAVTGWPASCLSLGARHYAATTSPEYPVPVSGDAQARMDAVRCMNYICGRMLKIQATADDHKWGTK